MHQLTGIPESQLQLVLGDLLIDGYKLVSKFRAADGTWTIVAKKDTPQDVGATVGGTVATSAGSAAVAGSSQPLAVDPEQVDRDPSKLHPLMRKAAEKLQRALDQASIPMKAFECHREPERQAFLYSKGRTRPGPKVTNAKPWESYHQYGLAVDFVRFENGRWNWNDGTATERAQWDRFHELARDLGLEPLSFEKPHVQVVGTSFAQLLNGVYPEGGDESWAASLSKSIRRWSGSPKPPEIDRPAAEVVVAPAGAAVSSEWHSRFGGDEWRFDDKGVYTKRPDGSEKLWRTAGAPLTAQEILTRFQDPIRKASSRHGVAPALIAMTIATETAAFRNVGFSGPKTFRWEAHVKVNATGDPAVDGIETGDYSAGPMQVLADTARWINGLRGLGYGAQTFAFFKNKPDPTKHDIGLYDPDACIDVGTAYIAHQRHLTGYDPLLVAAAYNAGGLRPSPDNHWRVRSHGNHIDRAAEWYGDACAVINGTA